MRDSAWEQPQVALVHVVDKCAPLLVHSRNPRRAEDHEGPLRTHLPVQFTHATLDQPHLHTGHLLRDRKVPHRHLTSPSAFFKTLMRKRERILDRRLLLALRSLYPRSRNQHCRPSLKKLPPAYLSLILLL